MIDEAILRAAFPHATLVMCVKANYSAPCQQSSCMWQVEGLSIYWEMGGTFRAISNIRSFLEADSLEDLIKKIKRDEYYLRATNMKLMVEHSINFAVTYLRSQHSARTSLKRTRTDGSESSDERMFALSDFTWRSKDSWTCSIETPERTMGTLYGDKNNATYTLQLTGMAPESDLANGKVAERLTGLRIVVPVYFDPDDSDMEEEKTYVPPAKVQRIEQSSGVLHRVMECVRGIFIKSDQR